MVMMKKRTRKSTELIKTEKQYISMLSDLIDNAFESPDYRHSGLYKMLRNKLSQLGYWKARPRGNPKKGWQKHLEATNRQ